LSYDEFGFPDAVQHEVVHCRSGIVVTSALKIPGQRSSICMPQRARETVVVKAQAHAIPIHSWPSLRYHLNE